MQRPPEYPENNQPPDEQDDDLVDKIYGPSQSDIDRSWDGYETGQGGSGRSLRGVVWKVAIVVVSLVILASMSLGILGPLLGGSSSPQQVAAPVRVDAMVLRVIDGITIVIDSGDGEQTVRFIGIESPPFGNPFYGFTQEVTASWIDGKGITLEADQVDRDEQGRLMRYVFLDNIMINAALLLNGLGTAETEHPNTRYDRYLADMERQARESEVGIWDPTFIGGADSADSAETQASAGFPVSTGYVSG
jgi:endonuclease YncB( thermonuclease family)